MCSFEEGGAPFREGLKYETPYETYRNMKKFKMQENQQSSWKSH
jgi:hypothetical protein